MSDLLYDTVAKLLLCPRCAKKIQPPAVVCSLGHAYCTDCSRMTVSCTTCASLFVSNNHILINSILEATENKEKFLEQLIQTLECPVCYYQMKICFLCVNGHGVCGPCSRYTQHCPLCREPFVHNYSYTIITLLATLNTKIKCSNWGQCGTSCTYSELLDHEAVCDNTMCFCIVDQCDWKGPYTNIASHVMLCHHSNTVSSDENILKLYKEKTNLKMFKAYGKTFWLMFDHKMDHLNIAVQIHDLQCNFIVEISFISKLDHIKLTRNILTIRENLVEAVREGNCLQISKEKLERMVSDQSTECYIKILKEGQNYNKSVIYQVMAMLFVLNLLLFCTKVAK